MNALRRHKFSLRVNNGFLFSGAAWQLGCSRRISVLAFKRIMWIWIGLIAQTQVADEKCCYGRTYLSQFACCNASTVGVHHGKFAVSTLYICHAAVEQGADVTRR